jgi:hypothetical protein
MTRFLKLRLARRKALQIRHVAREYQNAGQFAAIDTGAVFTYGSKAVQS